ncbi:MAG: SelT/SelW/SelH family protein [Caldilineaceae bacterium]
MAITQERFEQGLTYQAYKEQMTRNRERLEHNEQTVELTGEDVAFFSNLAAPVNVVAIAEDWCGDVINNLPVLAHLAEISKKLNVRVFLRDQNLDLMDQYLKEGKYRSIPVFALFDHNFTELGHFIERPAIMSELMGQMRKDLFTNDPLMSQYSPDTPFGDLPEEARGRLGQAFGAFREEHRRLSDQEVIRELRSLVEHGTIQHGKPTVAPISLQAPASNGVAPTKSQRPKVTITYCAECGYEPQTLELTRALMHAFVTELSSIELLPWHDGAFDVHINGDLVHSMYRDGGFPENETVIQAVRERLA